MASMDTLVLAVRRSKNPIHILCICLTCLLLQACAVNTSEPVASPEAAPAPIPNPTFDTTAAHCLNAHFDSLIQSNGFNGVALFASDGATHLIKSGHRNLQTRDTLRIDDQFQLASLSKPFTAFAVLQLVDQGKISLHAKVSDYLSDMPYADRTIHQLLCHTSGIGYYAYVTDNLWPDPALFMTNNDLRTMLACCEVPDYYRPGVQFDYCNTNYTLLADVVSEVSGKPFQQYMRRHVFEPMGMFNSQIIDAHKQSPTDFPVQGHYPSGKLKLPLYLDGVVGDKGMYSNVHDLYKFFEEWKHGNMLSDSLRELAVQPHAKSGLKQFYGYGWRLKTLQNGEQIIYHNGWWRGFRSYFWMSADGDKCVIALTNVIRGGYLDQNRIWSCF